MRYAAKCNLNSSDDELTKHGSLCIHIAIAETVGNSISLIDN